VHQFATHLPLLLQCWLSADVGSSVGPAVGANVGPLVGADVVWQW
jgi:hypothetical protein